MSESPQQEEVKPESVVSTVVMPGLKPVAERLESMKRLAGHLQTYIQNLEKGEEGALLVLRFTGDVRAVPNSKAEAIGIYDGDGVVLAVPAGGVPGMLSIMSEASLRVFYNMGSEDAVELVGKKIDELKLETDKVAADAAEKPSETGP